MELNGSREGSNGCQDTVSPNRMRILNEISLGDLRGDLFGGVTAAVVALLMALAFGVASRAGAEAGLYGAIRVGLFKDGCSSRNSASPWSSDLPRPSPARASTRKRPELSSLNSKRPHTSASLPCSMPWPRAPGSMSCGRPDGYASAWKPWDCCSAWPVSASLKPATRPCSRQCNALLHPIRPRVTRSRALANPASTVLNRSHLGLNASCGGKIAVFVHHKKYTVGLLTTITSTTLSKLSDSLPLSTLGAQIPAIVTAASSS